MTSLLRRKHRTTARRTTPATLAAKLAALVALVATPALAQPPPAYQPSNSTPNPLNYQSSGGPQSAAGQSGLLPLPPGYRPRTPPPQSQPAAQPQRPPATSGAVPGSGSGGTVMYFQKPADALAATGGPDATAGAVAQLNDPGRAPLAVPMPDATVAMLPPPPPASRYSPPDRPLTPPPARVIPPATPVAYSAQPEPQAKPGDDVPSTKAQKQELKDAPGGAAVTALPPREKVFMVYDDAQLEKAIIDRVIQQLLDENEKKKPEERVNPEVLVKNQDPRTVRFPALPIISPPGVPYRAKTITYEPRKMILEPGYVVHRRLHFEEKNAERAGWDLGPMQTLVSAAYFYRDAFLWPQSLASGCVFGFWGTSAGKCQPGTPAPYYIYPIGLTATGTVAEGIAITGGSFIFLP